MKIFKIILASTLIAILALADDVLEDTTNELTGKNNEIETLTNSKLACEAEIEKSKSELKIVNSKLLDVSGELKAEVESRVVAVSTLEKAIKEKEKQFSDELAVIEARKRETEAIFKSEVESRNEIVNNLQKAAAEMEGAHKSVVSGLEVSLATLNLELESAKSELTSIKALLVSSESKLKVEGALDAELVTVKAEKERYKAELSSAYKSLQTKTKSEDEKEVMPLPHTPPMTLHFSIKTLFMSNCNVLFLRSWLTRRHCCS